MSCVGHSALKSLAVLLCENVLDTSDNKVVVFILAAEDRAKTQHGPL